MPTFGKLTDGANSNTSSVDRRAASQATPQFNGQVSSITFRIWLDSAGTTNAKGVIYSDSAGSPGTLLATSDEITVTNTTEQALTANFSGANRIYITGGTPYWIGFIQKDPGVPSVIRSQDGTASLQASDTDTYATGPTTPWGAATLISGPLDVYVTYDGGGGTTAWFKA